MIDINEIKDDENIERIRDYIDLIRSNDKFNNGNVILRTINCQDEKSCKWYHDFISIFNDCTKEKLSIYSENVIVKYRYIYEKGKDFITVKEYKECMVKYDFLKNFKTTAITIEGLKGGRIEMSYNADAEIEFDAPLVMFNEDTKKFNIEDYYNSPIAEIQLETSFNMNDYIIKNK